MVMYTENAMIRLKNAITSALAIRCVSSPDLCFKYRNASRILPAILVSSLRFGMSCVDVRRAN